MNSKILMAIISLITIAYPVIVFFGLQHFTPQVVGATMLVLIGTRLIVARHNTAPWVKWSLIFAAILLTLSTVLNSQSLILFYPVVVNCTLMAIFGLSLLRPPTVIETLARISTPDLPPQGVKYTYRVTQIWTLFFAFNALMAAYTATFTSLTTWTFYNGLIAYALIGLIFGIEWLIRQKVKAGFQNDSQDNNQDNSQI